MECMDNFEWAVRLILFNVAGILAVRGLIAVWFFSNFPIHLFESLGLIEERHSVVTWDQFQIWLAAGVPAFLAELLSCPVCLSVWLSLGVAGAAVGAGLVPLEYLACALLWIGPVYDFYRKGEE